MQIRERSNVNIEYICVYIYTDKYIFNIYEIYRF